MWRILRCEHLASHPGKGDEVRRVLVGSAVGSPDGGRRNNDLSPYEGEIGSRVPDVAGVVASARYKWSSRAGCFSDLGLWTMEPSPTIHARRGDPCFMVMAALESMSPNTPRMGMV